MFIHTVAATVLKSPDLELDEDEAAKLGRAVSRVSELYDIPLMDEKTRAWMALAGVAGSIYAPRVITAYRRKKRGPVAVPEKSKVNSDVFNIHTIQGL
jgi:hypothetical protein